MTTYQRRLSLACSLGMILSLLGAVCYGQAVSSQFVPLEAHGSVLVPASVAPSLDLTERNLRALVDVLGSSTPGLDGVEEIGAASAGMLTSASVSGYGGPVGVRAAFDTVVLELQPTSATLPTHIRVRICENDSSGTVLAETTAVLPSDIATSTNFLQTIRFGQRISSAQPLWIDFNCNGNIGVRMLNSAAYTTPTYAASRLITSTGEALPSLTTATSSTTGTHYNIWSRFYLTGADNGTEVLPGTTFFGSSNVFSAYAFPVGVAQGFNRVEVDIKPDNPGNVPTTVRVRVLENNHSGAVLADVTFPVSLAYNKLARVVADIDYIANATGAGIWVEIYTDGYLGIRRNSAAILTAPQWRYSTAKSLTTLTLTEASGANTHKFSAKLSYVGLDRLRLSGTEDARAKLRTVAFREAITPTLTLPTLYGVVGEEVYVDLESLGRWPLPLSSYQVKVTCALNTTTNGTQSDYAWSAIPEAADVGSKTLTMTVSHDGNLLLTKSTTLVVKAATMSAQTRKVLTIGDSLTVDGYWLAELVNLGVDGQLTVTTVGGDQDIVNDAEATSRTVRNEALGGTTANYWYSDAASPFVFTGAFNFQSYLTAESITLSSSDWVIINLGVNDVFSASTDAACYTSLATMKTALDAMITNIRAAVSGVRVGICLPIAPAAEQHAFGDDYGTSQSRARYKRNHDLTVAFLQDVYGAQTANNQFIIPLHASVDTRNNFPTSTVAANAYNATTVTRQTNGVHPATTGQYQIGAAVYAALRGQE